MEKCKCGHPAVGHYVKEPVGQRFCAYITCNCTDYSPKPQPKPIEPDDNQEG